MCVLWHRRLTRKSKQCAFHEQTLWSMRGHEAGVKQQNHEKGEACVPPCMNHGTREPPAGLGERTLPGQDWKST